MASVLWQLLIDRYAAGSHPSVGHRLNLTDEIVTLGRLTSCSCTVDDPSISSVHVAIHRIGDRLSIKCHARNGYTAVNGHELASGDHLVLDRDVNELQLGDFHAVIRPAPKTRPPRHRFSENLTGLQPLIAVTVLQKTGDIVVDIDGGRSPLAPAPSRLLRLLVENVGEFVPYDHVENHFDPHHTGHCPQIHRLIHAVRGALDDALASSSSSWPGVLDGREDVPRPTTRKKSSWGHRLVETRNGLGYRLRLQKPDVRFETAI